jgi:putative spermidine/putrescine transport system substrate-binding protein
MEGKLTRRQALTHAGGFAAVVAAPGLLAACGSDDEEAAPAKESSPAAGQMPEVTSDRAVFATFGGETDDARRAAFFDDFEKETGARVVTAAWDIGKFMLMADKEQAEWDSIDAEGYTVIQLAQSNDLQKLPDWVTRCDLIPTEWQDYTSGGYASSYNLGYNTETVGAELTGWADFFDLDKYPGKRAFPRYVFSSTAEAALIADGVARDELYPLDFERAFAKLDEIKSEILVFESYAQSQQFLSQGAAAMAIMPSGRWVQLQGQGQPIEIVWQDALLYPYTSMPVLKNAPNPDAIFALIHIMSDPERQVEFAKLTGYGPTNSKALELMDEETRANMCNSPEHVEIAIEVDYDFLAANEAEYAERFNDWLAA